MVAEGVCYFRRTGLFLPVGSFRPGRKVPRLGTMHALLPASFLDSRLKEFFVMDDRLAIREFVQGLLRRNGDEDAFSDDEQLIARGRLQSVDTLEVLLFLEEKYGVDFAEAG